MTNSPVCPDAARFPWVRLSRAPAHQSAKVPGTWQQCSTGQQSDRHFYRFYPIYPLLSLLSLMTPLTQNLDSCEGPHD